MKTKSNLTQFTPKRTRLFEYVPHLDEDMIKQLEEENKRLQNKLTSLENVALSSPDAVIEILKK